MKDIQIVELCSLLTETQLEAHELDYRTVESSVSNAYLVDNAFGRENLRLFIGVSKAIIEIDCYASIADPLLAPRLQQLGTTLQLGNPYKDLETIGWRFQLQNCSDPVLLQTWIEDVFQEMSATIL